MTNSAPQRRTRTIMAAVCHGAGRPLSLESLEIDEPRDDEVLVRIVASGICHTDIDWCETQDSGASVLGHEGAGIVEEAGHSVRGIEPGDHVVLSYQSCGRCPACRQSRPANCDEFWRLNFGFERLDGSSAYAGADVSGHFFGQSSFATYVLATERNMVKVDKALPLKQLAPLGCGLLTGAGTVMNSLAVKGGQSIIILGVGSVGLAAVMAARLVGAHPIIAVDVHPKRLALARELGATHAIDSRNAEVGKVVATIATVDIDHVIDDTGDPALIDAGLRLLKPSGQMALLTGGGARESGGGHRILNIIQGDAIPQQFIPQLIDLWRRGDFPFDRLIKVYDFADINRAIADSRRGTTIKPVVQMSPDT